MVLYFLTGSLYVVHWGFFSSFFRRDRTRRVGRCLCSRDATNGVV